MSYRNIIHFQIKSSRKNWQKGTWVIKNKVLGKHFSKQFYFIKCRRGQLQVVDYRGGIADLLLLRALLAIWQKSLVLIAYTRFSMLVQTKKRFLWNMIAAQTVENDGDEGGWPDI